MIDAPARWYQRVLPVSVLTVAVVALAALLLPGVRTQLALSATHQPEPYVELAFARTTVGVQSACGGVVAFDVTSHLAEPERLAYVVTVTGHRTIRRTGHVSVDPAHTARVVRKIPRLPGRSVVTVRLPAQHQLIRAHCSAPPKAGRAR